jgi:KAP family P-loop domain/Putative peptidoglycan binding domain
LSEAPAQSATPQSVLQRNSTGPEVDALKRQLSMVGFDPGPLGEAFGTRTYRAVVAFQRNEGLEPDGIVGSRTWEALDHAVSTRAARQKGAAKRSATTTLAGDEMTGPSPASRITRTPSVEGVARLAQPMTAAALAKTLWEEHPGYPNRDRAIELLRTSEQNGSAPTRTAVDWVSAVESLLDEHAVGAQPGGLHGRLLIYGLTKVEPELGRLLEADGILDELRTVMTPDPETLFRAPPSASRGGRRADDAKLIADAPADVDLLDREGFATVLARLLRNQRGHSGFGSGPLLVHLYGPWGSGKTSLAGFLRRAFEKPEAISAEGEGVPDPWLFVTFNAWRHQRVAPPWWWLMDAIYHDAVRRSRRDGGLPLRRRIAVWWWRWGLMVLATLAITGLVVLAVAFGVLSIERLTQADNAVKAVLAFVVTAGSAITLFRSTRSSLLVGSPRAASAILRSGGDPFRRVHDRYRALTKRVHRRLIVFVDDLDRCQPNYVVELLEGIQTIFTDVPVTYVVAADREWVGQSFQGQYRDFGDVMSRPGRPMGYLFLEKTFAVSAPLPRPSATAQRRYRDAVLSGRDGGEEPITPEARADAWRLVGSASLDDAMDAVASLDVADGSAGARAVREAAASRVADAIVEGAQDRVLQPYLDLVEENPRTLKRLRNAYAIATVGRVTTGEVESDTNRDGLVRWTILALRWPRLAAYVLEHPEHLADFLPRPGAAGDGNVPVELAALRGDPALTKLLTEPAGEAQVSLVEWVVTEFGRPGVNSDTRFVPSVAPNASQTS